MIYCASGPILENQTVLGSAAEIVGALVEIHLAGCDSDRPMARRAIAVGVADEVQSALLKDSIGDQFWSYAGASDSEISRLTRSRAIADSGKPWTSRAVALVVVRPDGAWTKPAGRCLVVDPTTDARLLSSLVELGWLRVEQLEYTPN